MHSSRMHTARSLTVSRRIPCIPHCNHACHPTTTHAPTTTHDPPQPCIPLEGASQVCMLPGGMHASWEGVNASGETCMLSGGACMLPRGGCACFQGKGHAYFLVGMHGGGHAWGHMCGGSCMAGGMHGRGHVQWGSCMAGSMVGEEVPCDLSHHAFDVTCMLPSQQLSHINSAPAYIVLPGHVTCKACWDTHARPPLWTDSHL